MGVKRLIWSLVTRIQQRRNAYRNVVVTPQERKQLRKSRRRWEYNNKVYLKKVAGNGTV
jgi:hypothetical protein